MSGLVLVSMDTSPKEQPYSLDHKIPRQCLGYALQYCDERITSGKTKGDSFDSQYNEQDRHNAT